MLNFDPSGGHRNCEAFPWSCFRMLLRDWPGIEFGAVFNDEFGRFDKTWPVVEVSDVKKAA